MNPKRIILAGGGTGGHVLPIVAVAEALVAGGVSESSIEFVASARGPDRTLLEPLAYSATYVTGRGLQRSMKPRAIIDNVGAMFGLLRAIGTTVANVRRWHPRVIVSAGGYAALPAVVASIVLRIPLVLVNIDAVPGAVHRLFGRFAVASCVGFPGTDLPHPIVTGAPLAEAISSAKVDEASIAAARRHLGLGTGRVLAVVGGSLGARSLNRATMELAALGLDDLEIYHVAGRRDFDALDAKRWDMGAPANYHLVPFERAMADLYVAADIVVARAGAMTVAELAAVGVPSILVPLPGAPGDHQTKNAQVLVDAGAALLVADGALNGKMLQELLVSLDNEDLAQMRAHGATVHSADAAAKIAAVIIDYAC